MMGTPSLGVCWKSLIATAVMTLPLSGLRAEIQDHQNTDASLEQLPSDIESLSLRGSTGYGNDVVTDHGIAHLVKFKKLRILHAGALGLTDRSLEPIGELTELEELSLDGNKIDGSGLHYLLGLKKLRKLNLSFNPLRVGWAETVAQMIQLRELRAITNDRPLDDATLLHLTRLKELEYLELNDDAKLVTDEGVCALTELTRLTMVSLREATVSEVALQRLGNLPQLRLLRLRSLRMPPAGSLGWLPRLARLKELDLVDLAMNAKDLAAINQLQSLESLLLWNARWENSVQAIEHLNGLKSLRAIRTNEILKPKALIDLSLIPSIESIGDDLPELTDVELLELSKLEKLQVLFLDSPNITRQSLSTLATMKSLRFLSVSDRVNIAPGELLGLGRDSLPNCKIVARTGNKVYYDPTSHP